MIKGQFPYVGCHVKIIWRNPENDWPNFEILAAYKDGGAVYFWLKGEEWDGAEHDGIPFTAIEADIQRIEVRKMKRKGVE